MARGFQSSAGQYSAQEGVATDGQFSSVKAYKIPSKGPDVNMFGEDINKYYYGLLRDQSSPARFAQLEEIRDKSAINIPVFRGMRAMEVLDSKKAEERIKEKNLDASKDVYSGSAGDGLYHFTPDVGHARQFTEDLPRSESSRPTSRQEAVVEGVINSKHILDLREFGILPDQWYEKTTGEDIYGLYKRLRNEGSDYGGTGSDYQLEKWVTGIVESINRQYKDNFGKDLPSLGRSGGDGRKAIVDSIIKDFSKIKLPTSWTLLKTDTFKKIFKDSQFDAVGYTDKSSSGEAPAFAVKSPSQFKAYYGDKPVNTKSNNIFDADK